MGERYCLNDKFFIFIDHFFQVLLQCMKNDLEVQRRLRASQLRRDDIIKSAMTEDVQISHPTLQVHGEQQAHESQVMIAMKVADEDMIDAVEVCLQFHQLHLRSFAAIQQEVFAFDL